MLTTYEGVVVSKTYIPIGRGYSLVEFQLTTGDLRTLSVEDRYGRIPCASPLVRYTIVVNAETKCIVYVDALRTIDAVSIDALCAAEPNSAKVFKSARLKIKGLALKQTITRETRDALVNALGGAKSSEGAHLLRLVSDDFLTFHAWLTERGDGGDTVTAAALHWTRCTGAAALPSRDAYPTRDDVWRAAFHEPEPDYDALVFEKQDLFPHPPWLTRDVYREYKEFMATTRIQGHLCVSVPSFVGDVLAHRLRIARQTAPPVEQTPRQRGVWFMQSRFDDATMFVRALFEEPDTLGATSGALRAQLVELSHAHDFEGMRDAIDSIDNFFNETIACYAPSARCARELTSELGVHVREHTDTPPEGGVSVCCIFYAQDFDICALVAALHAHLTPALKHVLLVGDATLPPPNYARGQIFRDLLQFVRHDDARAARVVVSRHRAQHPFLATRYSVEARSEWCDTVSHFSRTAEAAVSIDVCVTDNAFAAGWRPSLGDDTVYLVADDARANALTRDLTQPIVKNTWCFIPPHIGRISAVFFKTDFSDALAASCTWRDRAMCCSKESEYHADGANHPFKFLHVLPVSIVPTSLRVDHVVFEVDPAKTCWADIYRVLCCARRSIMFYVLGVPDERDTGKQTLMQVLARTNVRMHHITDTSIWSKPLPAEITYTSTTTAAAPAVDDESDDDVSHSETSSSSTSCSDSDSSNSDSDSDSDSNSDVDE